MHTARSENYFTTANCYHIKSALSKVHSLYSLTAAVSLLLKVLYNYLPICMCYNYCTVYTVQCVHCTYCIVAVCCRCEWNGAVVAVFSADWQTPSQSPLPPIVTRKPRRPPKLMHVLKVWIDYIILNHVLHPYSAEELLSIPLTPEWTNMSAKFSANYALILVRLVTIECSSLIVK